MKKLVFLGLLLVLMPIVMADTTQTLIMQKGQSHVIENNNITLVEFSKKEDRAIVCVNNRKEIVIEDEEERVGVVNVELKSFTDGGVRFRFEVECDECVVSDNSACFPKKLEGELMEEPEITPEVERADVEEVETTPEVNEPEVEEERYKGVIKLVWDFIVSLFR